ncbi:hypothetical protein ElyMa_004937600 [Elysia marginata]|uniref:Uncharacterized protein n=1 Tax=Elysia marginata TaxID=1093978 RepID=A0AAV4J2F2_9GAST|nr:hypothetical protein ElyMa_004937600 [Elysia marginata]
MATTNAQTYLQNVIQAHVVSYNGTNREFFFNETTKELTQLRLLNSFLKKPTFKFLPALSLGLNPTKNLRVNLQRRVGNRTQQHEDVGDLEHSPWRQRDAIPSHFLQSQLGR